MTYEEAQDRSRQAVADAAMIWGQGQLERLAAVGMDAAEAEALVCERMRTPAFERWARDTHAALVRWFVHPDAVATRLH